MKLYITLISSYARLARILVIEKALEDRVEVIAAKTRIADSPYYQINPSGRVPGPRGFPFGLTLIPDRNGVVGRRVVGLSPGQCVWSTASPSACPGPRARFGQFHALGVPAPLERATGPRLRNVHSERRRNTLARMTPDIEAFLKRLRSHPEILSAARSNPKLYGDLLRLQGGPRSCSEVPTATSGCGIYSAMCAMRLLGTSAASSSGFCGSAKLWRRPRNVTKSPGARGPSLDRSLSPFGTTRSVRGQHWRRKWLGGL